MEQSTLDQILGGDSPPASSFTGDQAQHVFSSALPTGEGPFEYVLGLFGVREHYDKLLEGVQLSSSISFYLFVALATIMLYFTLRAWRIQSYAKEKRKPLRREYPY